MSDERSTLLFLIGLASVALFIFVLTSIQQWNRSRRAQSKDCQINSNNTEYKAEPERPERPGASVIRHIDLIAIAIRAYHNKRDAHERHRARSDKKTLNALTFTASFSFAAFIAAGCADIIFFRQLNVMQEEQRPWIEIAPTTGMVALAGEMLNIKVKIIMNNTGHRPAIGIEFSVDLVLVTSGNVMIKDNKIEKTQCAMAKAAKYESRMIGVSIPPGGKREMWVVPTLPIKNIPEDPQHDGRHSAMLNVVGCIDYIDAATQEHGQTGFRFSVSRKGGPADPIPYLIYMEDGSLGPDRVMVDEEMYGNYQK